MSRPSCTTVSLTGPYYIALDTLPSMSTVAMMSTPITVIVENIIVYNENQVVAIVEDVVIDEEDNIAEVFLLVEAVELVDDTFKVAGERTVADEAVKEEGTR